MLHDVNMMERRGLNFRLTPGCHVSATMDSDAFLFNRSLNLPSRLAIEINELTFHLKQANVWTKLKAIYPFIACEIGTTRTAGKDLKRASSVPTFTNPANFVYAKTGIKPNGSNTLLNTGWSPFANLSTFNHHLAYYSRTQNTNSGYYMGANNTGNTNPRCNMYFLTTDTIRSYSHATVFGVSAGTGGSSGFIVISRSANNVQKIFKNGSQLGSTDTATVSGNYPDISIIIGAANNGVGGGQAHGDKECAFASMGDSLTDVEVAKLNFVVQLYNTRLCRNV